jgi:hypothetical protein
VKRIGESTNAKSKRIPGRKNLRGIEIFVKYVKTNKKIVAARKAAMRYSP